MAVVPFRFFSYPKRVTVEVVPDSVPFPAISMCNMRNLDFHVLNTLNRLEQCIVNAVARDSAAVTHE